MFTGIVETVGTLRTIRRQREDAVISVQSGALDLSDVRRGDSIAVNGVCLTVTAFTDDGFQADVSGETLRHTTLGSLQRGSKLNLEKALTLNTRLGGHLVSGHVDGVGEIVRCAQEGLSLQLDIDAPVALARYVAARGSITVDGVSLTVNAVQGAVLRLNLIPQTQADTLAGSYRTGVWVNLEVDILARYLERLLLAEQAVSGESITRDFLAEHGFA